MKLGFDVDGCLANFTDSYASELTKVSGIVFPKASSEWPTAWFWDREMGVTHTDESKVWKGVIMKEGSTFWQTLAPLEGANEVLKLLNHRIKLGDEVYFITNRMGDQAKLQTEKWLYEWGIDYPTVILSAEKTPLIKLLGLEFFIDDKWETMRDLYKEAEAEGWLNGKSFYLKDAPYNRDKRNEWREMKVALDVMGALKEVGIG